MGASKSKIMTLENVSEYYKNTLKKHIEFLINITIVNDKKFNEFVLSLQQKKILKEIENAFILFTEDNPSSLVLETYMVSINNARTKHAILSAIHDGWALSKFILLIKNANSVNSAKVPENYQFKCEYKASQINSETIKPIIIGPFNIETLHHDPNSPEKLLLMEYLNLCELPDMNRYKSILIKFSFNIKQQDYSTLIRADQLRMLLPFDDLSETIQATDVPFYERNFKKKRNENVKKLEDFIKQKGGRRKKSKHHDK